jgi:hypothetical protein
VEILQASISHPEQRVQICEQLDSLLKELKDRIAPDLPIPVPPVPFGESFEETPAYKALTVQFGPEIGVRKLKTIAAAVADHRKLMPPSRAVNRQKKLLFQWFNENWEKVHDVIQYVKAQDVKDSDSGEELSI